MAFTIETVNAWVSRDDDGEEGIVGFLAGNGQWMPMIMADEARLNALKPMAQSIANTTRRPVYRLQFAVRMEMETLEPQ